jgi:dTDP-4-amino-4,6-dideoxyglucose formyltransferase
MKFAFAGDRKISCSILEFIISKGFSPAALLISDFDKASHDEELIQISGLNESLIFRGNEFKNPQTLELLLSLDLDYIFGIHFPYIIPNEVLSIPKIGVVNLHPAFLPYNKGWHTPSWAIIEGHPYGATLHFMEEALDEGDIIHQKQIEVLPIDTANSLYKRVLKLEEEVFFEAFDNLCSLNPKRIKQTGKGTSHQKKELKALQEITISENSNPIDLIHKIRALTTNDKDEAAYFMIDNKKIGVQINLFYQNE